jgi:hypothetical protein
MTGSRPTDRLDKAGHPLNRPITSNERAWIDFLRLVSDDSDPAPTLERIQKLRLIFAKTRRW